MRTINSKSRKVEEGWSLEAAEEIWEVRNGEAGEDRLRVLIGLGRTMVVDLSPPGLFFRTAMEEETEKNT